MYRLKSFILYLVLALNLTGLAMGQTASPDIYTAFVDSTVTVCPASEADKVPPVKESVLCKDIKIHDLDPQAKHIWALFSLQIPDSMMDSYAPLGIGLSAKASSFIYINGREVGRNGLPTDTREREHIGQMDVTFPLRDGILRAGENEVAIRMSSHSGLLSLGSPIHSVYVSSYEKQQSRMLRRYSPSLLPFGVFILGGLYFLVISTVSKQKSQAGLLSLMSIIVACQLFAEVSRSLFAYPYIWHDYRLISILICSALFGLCLSTYIVRVFGRQHQTKWFALIGISTLLALLVPESFDAKSAFSLLFQTVLSLAVVLFYWRDNPYKSALFSSVLFIFGIVNLISPNKFLDIYFFYGIAVLMLFLFVQQALAYAEEQALRQEEEVRANKLQLVLDQRKEEKQTAILSLSEAGKIHQVLAKDIICISGADDYVDVILKSGKSKLVSSTLSKMETQLPSFFLRVHRSHIVNTNFIESLEREATGKGHLVLTQGEKLPVSRRIMPSIRKALSQS